MTQGPGFGARTNTQRAPIGVLREYITMSRKKSQGRLAECPKHHDEQMS